MYKRPRKLDQRGIASLIVTMVVLGIVTLITVGFATLIRREQRQVLDQQLSTQAFYAAESGVNAARTYIDSLAGVPLEYSRCQDMPAGIVNLPATGPNTSFSCVLIDTSPRNLQKEVGTEESWVVKVAAKTGVINRIRISWDAKSGSSFADPSLSTTHLLLPKPRWGNRAPILRTTLMPDSTNRATLTNGAFNLFLYPNAGNTGTNTKAYAPGTLTEQGDFVDGNCNAASTPDCSSEITGLGASSYYLRLKSIYQPAIVTITAYQNGSSEPIELQDGQAEIDVTGKASDVLRRIRVKVPLSAHNIFPEFALESFDTVCKRFAARPGYAQEQLNGFSDTTDACLLD